MMRVRYPLSLPHLEDLLAKRGIDISHEIDLARSQPRFVGDDSWTSGAILNGDDGVDSPS
jgi:hypothetical protein